MERDGVDFPFFCWANFYTYLFSAAAANFIYVFYPSDMPPDMRITTTVIAFFCILQMITYMRYAYSFYCAVDEFQTEKMQKRRELRRLREAEQKAKKDS